MKDVSKNRTMVMVILILSLTGCGTISGRLGDARMVGTDYYIGANTDFQTLGASGGNKNMLGCYLSIVCPLFVIASVPVDAVIDTVLLPIDYLRADTIGLMTYQQAKVQNGDGSITFDFSNSNQLPEGKAMVRYAINYTGSMNDTTLFVDAVPLMNKRAVIYIPKLDKYSAAWIYIVYNSFQDRAEFKFKTVTPPQPQRNTPFLYRDGNESYILVTPALTNKGISLVEDTYSYSGGHTY